MTVKHIIPNPDSRLPGVHVIGYHGQLGPNQNPARRLPVYSDDAGFQVKILESGSRSIRIQCLTEKAPDRVWATTGTRIDPPWPAVRHASIMLIIGERCLDALLEPGHHRDFVDSSGLISVKEFLIWAESEQQHSNELRCIRIGDLIAWNTSPEVADILCDQIASVARREVFRANRDGQRHELKRASFWLSRAAIRDEDLLLAAAGLRRSGSEFWEDLLHAAIKSGTKERRLALAAQAERFLMNHETDKINR